MNQETPNTQAPIPPTLNPPPPLRPPGMAQTPIQDMGRSLMNRGKQGIDSSVFRLLMIGVLVLALLIPMSMIQGLRRERQRRCNEAVENITTTWGKAQEIVGPVLIVPYQFPVKVTRPQTVNGRVEQIEVEEIRTAFAHFLPERLEIDGKLAPQMLHRGIYEAVVYRGEIALAGFFKAPTFTDWKVKPEQVQWDEAVVGFAVTDMRGVDGALELTWDGSALPLAPGCRLAGFGSGLTARLKTAPAPGNDHIAFSLALNLNGSREIRFTPLGVQNEVSLTAPWPDPSFIGAFLPTKREVAADRFSAQWSVSYYGRSYPQQWTTNYGGAASADQMHESMFGVSLLNVVDAYRIVERTMKYAVLFLVLVFSAYFLFEVLSGLRIHPVQYILVGAALCLLYLGLLALSEMIGFGLAYLTGAGLATLLIGFYSTGVLKSYRRGGLLTAGLALVYGFLYVVLQLQDYSLLLGTAGLFLLLAAIMIATRKMDWYARDAASHSEKT